MQLTFSAQVAFGALTWTCLSTPLNALYLLLGPVAFNHFILFSIRACVMAFVWLLGQRWIISVPVVEELSPVLQINTALQVVSRTFFRHPWQVLIRRATDSDELPGSYKIEAGQDVMISVYNIHHSSQVWENAEEFIPERFDLDGPVPNESNTDFKWVAPPFYILPTMNDFFAVSIYGGDMSACFVTQTNVWDVVFVSGM